MKKVVIGLSGGVDSSVAAYLLKKKGYEVVGVSLRMTEENDFSDAVSVAEKLGIEYFIEDVSGDFGTYVQDYFLEEYSKGHTPNPCNICNRRVKFEHLCRIADREGALYVATGHYAKVLELAGGLYSIANAECAEKDQTYALCRLSQEQIKRILMPLGEYSKAEVREIAASQNLPVAHKKDSQDICFIPDGDYGRYLLQRNIKSIRGNFVSEEGDILGQHEGIHKYTYGQRRGLNIAAGERIFVTDINDKTGDIVLGSNQSLFSREVFIRDINWMGSSGFGDKTYLGKIRYAHKGEACTVHPFGNGGLVEFREPVRAATPGQFCVMYYEGCIGLSGIICRKEDLQK